MNPGAVILDKSVCLSVCDIEHDQAIDGCNLAVSKQLSSLMELSQSQQLQDWEVLCIMGLGNSEVTLSCLLVSIHNVFCSVFMPDNSL
jgi:hypothetical protein